MTDPRPPRDSATVLLLRDEPGQDGGLEVFMVRRNLNSDFVGGAYVFPGGGLDAGDLDPALLARLEGVTDARADRLGLDAARARAHWVAAIRETYEEAGVLLAGAAGTRVALDPAIRKAMLARETTFGAIAEAHDLALAGGDVAYFSHWVTPVGTPKRFSTRFFAAVLPESQEPVADDMEVEAGVWIRPADALAARDRGEMTLIFPTVKTLEELSTYGHAADVLAACRDRAVVANLPRIVLREGVPAVLLPGDDGYEAAADAPTPAFDPSRL